MEFKNKLICAEEPTKKSQESETPQISKSGGESKVKTRKVR